MKVEKNTRVYITESELSKIITDYFQRCGYDSLSHAIREGCEFDFSDQGLIVEMIAPEISHV